MHRYKNYILFICAFLIIFILYQMYNQTTTTMKYFPIDESTFILDAFTELQYDSKEDIVNWTVHSSSSDQVYLRQDVSLVYQNGMFKGIQSKWKNNETFIEQNEVIPFKDDTLLQSITFHHGEVHHNNNQDQITSMQQMTDASLYLIRENATVHHFREPSTSKEKKWQEKLTKKTTQQLQTHLDTLLDFHQITIDNYDAIPLHELSKYNDQPLPNLNMDITSKVIGQFWEGFYNNYITLLMSYKKEIPPHYMPFILVAKDQSHLLVLYEMDGEKEKLIQHITP